MRFFPLWYSDLWTLTSLVFLCSQLPCLNSGNTLGFPWLPLPGLWSGNSPKSASWGSLLFLFHHSVITGLCFLIFNGTKAIFSYTLSRFLVASCGRANLISVLQQLKCLCLNSESHSCQRPPELSAFLSFWCWSSVNNVVSLSCKPHPKKLHSIPKNSRHRAARWTSLPSVDS